MKNDFQLHKNQTPLGNSFIEEFKGYNDSIQEFINKLSSESSKKKQQLILQRLEQLGIKINYEAEATIKFKNILREHKGDEETYYYNDGSPNAIRIITFVSKLTPFDPDKFSIGYETTYY